MQLSNTAISTRRVYSVSQPRALSGNIKLHSSNNSELLPNDISAAENVRATSATSEYAQATHNVMSNTIKVPLLRTPGPGKSLSCLRRRTVPTADDSRCSSNLAPERNLLLAKVRNITLNNALAIVGLTLPMKSYPTATADEAQSTTVLTKTASQGPYAVIMMQEANKVFSTGALQTRGVCHAIAEVLPKMNVKRSGT